jgi:hypothetical protein
MAGIVVTNFANRRKPNRSGSAPRPA